MVLFLERNPVSSLHSQQVCNQFPSREALLHCIENWSGTESFWPQCLLGYDFGLLLIVPTSSGQHNSTPYCSEKATQQGLGVCAGAAQSEAWRWSPAEDNLKFTCSHKSGFWRLGSYLPSPLQSGELSLLKKEDWAFFFFFFMVIFSEKLVKCYAGKGWLTSLDLTPRTLILPSSPNVSVVG